jgi:Tfp pilus assembly PilM family ATPase
MADFTKEELEEILAWGDTYRGYNMSFMYKFQKPLVDKIQAMIDNYCNHENLKDVGKNYRVCRNCAGEIYE